MCIPCPLLQHRESTEIDLWLGPSIEINRSHFPHDFRFMYCVLYVHKFCDLCAKSASPRRMKSWDKQMCSEMHDDDSCLSVRVWIIGTAQACGNREATADRGRARGREDGTDGESKQKTLSFCVCSNLWLIWLARSEILVKSDAPGSHPRANNKNVRVAPCWAQQWRVCVCACLCVQARNKIRLTRAVPRAVPEFRPPAAKSHSNGCASGDSPECPIAWHGIAYVVQCGRFRLLKMMKINNDVFHMKIGRYGQSPHK